MNIESIIEGLKQDGWKQEGWGRDNGSEEWTFSKGEKAIRLIDFDASELDEVVE